jgi:hypothetical protein
VIRWAALPLALTLTGCTMPTCQRLGGMPMLEYQLFFGRSNVPDQAWTAFAAQVITPDLPSGFTELEAEGQWMNPDTRQISRERSRVVIVAVPDSPATAAAIARIKDEYRQRFAQIAVGTIVHPVCAAF